MILISFKNQFVDTLLLAVLTVYKTVWMGWNFSKITLQTEPSA